MPQKRTFVIGNDTLDLDTFAAVCAGDLDVVLGADARRKVERCDAFRQELAESSHRIYGVNTGFGKLADQVIPLSGQALQFIVRGDLAGPRRGVAMSLSEPLEDLLAGLGGVIDLGPGDRPLSDDLEKVVSWLRDSRLPERTGACLETI